MPVMGFQSWKCLEIGTWHSLSWDLCSGLYLSNSMPDKRSKLYPASSFLPQQLKEKTKNRGVVFSCWLCPFSTPFPDRPHHLWSSSAHPAQFLMEVFSILSASSWLPFASQKLSFNFAQTSQGLVWTSDSSLLCSLSSLPACCLLTLCSASDTSSAPIFFWLLISSLQKTPWVSQLSFAFSLNLFFAIPAHLHSHTLLLMWHPWVSSALTAYWSPFPTPCLTTTLPSLWWLPSWPCTSNVTDGHQKSTSLKASLPKLRLLLFSLLYFGNFQTYRKIATTTTTTKVNCVLPQELLLALCSVCSALCLQIYI